MTTALQKALLVDAIKKDDLTRLRDLVNEGAPVVGREDPGYYLRTAAVHAGPEMLRFLVDQGVDPQIKRQGGATLLFDCNAANVGTLVALKVDIDTQDDDGGTALIHAVQCLRHEAFLHKVFELLRYGADPNLGDANFVPPLSHVFGNSSICQAQAVDALVAAGADVARRDADGGSPLLHSIGRFGHVDGMIRLLEHGARFDPDSGQLQRAVRFCLEKNASHGLSALRDIAGFDACAGGGGQWLHAAFKCKSPQGLLWFLEAGVHPDAVDARGKGVKSISHRVPECMEVLQAFTRRRAAGIALDEVKASLRLAPGI